MTHYEIIMTPDASSDLTELKNYIAYILLAPDTALSYIRAIRKEISSLSEMPDRIKPVDEEPWHSRGIRKIIARNFYVYYRIENNSHRVYVLNIIYSKRDQLRMLAQMDTGKPPTK